MKKKQPEIRTAADLVGIKGSRAVAIKREAINEDARTVNLAFATETPVERWFGFEILDCSKKAIRLDRLKSRAPILVDHDSTDQVGVIESVTIGDDKIGRCDARFSKATRANEVFNDVVDEIRTNTSVGYVIHEAVLESEKDGVPTYRVTDWEPYEVSLVSMPADIQCGVGRAADLDENERQQKEQRTMKKCKICGADLTEGEVCAACEAKNVELREKAASEARAAELQRVAEIRNAGKAFASRGGIDLAETVAADPNGTVDSFRSAMLDKISQEDQTSQGTVRDGVQSQNTSRVAENLRYYKRSLEPFMRGAGGNSREAEREAYTAGMWAQAVIFGNDNAVRWCKDHSVNLRVMTSDNNPAAGYLVPDSMETAIIDLRAEYGVARQLAEFWPMSSGTLAIPVRQSGTTAYFPGQQDATTASDMGWGEVNLVAKDVSALTRLSDALAEDAVIDLAAKIADEHAYAFAVKEDSCLIDGDGTSGYGGITGLKALLEVSGMAGIYTAASASDTPAEIIAAELSGVMSKLPSFARKGATWLASPTFDELIFSRLMAAGGGNNTATLAGEIVPAYLGKARVVCEPCYSNPATDLTGKAMLFYGNLKQGVAFGERRGITVKVLRERYAEYRQIGVIGTERIDINCHGVGDTSAAGPIVALIGG